jgi:hypothetical protein
VGTGAAPTVTVNGATVPVVMDNDDKTAEITAVLKAGGDYTLMVYLDGSNNPKAKIIPDNNTAPTTSSGVKFRMINLASDNQGLQLSMSVNKASVASLVTYATASDYREISVPQATASTVDILNGAKTLKTYTSVLTLPNIFTEIVVSVPASGDILDFFSTAAGT